MEVKGSLGSFSRRRTIPNKESSRDGIREQDQGQVFSL